MGNFFTSGENKQSEIDSKTESSDEDYQSCNEELNKKIVKHKIPAQKKARKEVSNISLNHHVVGEPSIMEDLESSDSENTPSDRDLDSISDSEGICSNDFESLSSNSYFNLTNNNMNNSTFYSSKGKFLNDQKTFKINEKGDGFLINDENSFQSALDSTVQEKLGCLKWEINFEEENKKSVPKKKTKPPHLKHLKSKKSLAQKRKDYNRSISYSLPITLADVVERKVLDLRRWYCMSRPQYKKSCGLTSLVSVWNYLYSNLGTGELNPITQEDALNILGFKPPFGEIRFGPFTGNATLMRWFRRLNEFFCVNGNAKYMYKPKGKLQTKAIGDEGALSLLTTGLRNENTAFIYHCLNHYFCPIGYEETPQDPTEAYCSKRYIEEKMLQQTNDVNNDLSNNVQGKLETWVFIGEPSRKHPPIHCKKWSDILQDLHMEGPFFYDIRRQEKGIQERKSKKKGGNLHCIIVFKKTDKPVRKLKKAASSTPS